MTWTSERPAATAPRQRPVRRTTPMGLRALQMDGWTRGVSVSYPATPDSVRAIRKLVGDLARRAGANADLLEAVRLAVSEAATNAAIHAYAAGVPGLIHVSASAAGDELTVLIADDGRGHRVPTDRPGLGWGWKLIADACDRLTILERAGGGTELRMHWQIRYDADDPFGEGPDDGVQRRGSDRSAAWAASPRFSTTK